MGQRVRRAAADQRRESEAEREDIVEIIPADGWRALYVTTDDDGGMRLHDVPLVAWARVRFWYPDSPAQEEREGHHHVEGVTLWNGRSPFQARWDDEFVCYLRPGEVDLELYRPQAAEVATRLHARSAPRPDAAPDPARTRDRRELRLVPTDANDR